MKVGFLQSVSIKWPTSLSISLEIVLGFEHSTPFSLHSLSRKILVSSVLRSAPLGILTPIAASRPSNIGILLKGGEKSISITFSLSSGPLGWY